MTITPEEVGLRVRESNRNHTMRSARAKQQEEHRIGASEVGLCRSYLKYMTDGTEYDAQDAPDDKLAAFVGTAVGDLAETAYSASNPYAVVQASFVATLPSGKVIECHSDIIDPDINALIDIKTKNGLELVIKDGKPSRQYQYQVAIYLLGAIQSKLLKPGARAFLCYIDRSGKDPRVVTYEVIVNEFTYQEIDEWIGEAMYSVEHDLPAPKDQEYNFCESYCRFFSTCRGGESFAEGVIEDPEAASALTMRIESMAVIKEATARKDQADAVLKEHAITGGLILSDVGPYEISRTLVNGGHVSFDKADYYRLNVRKQKPTKPEKTVKA